MTKAQALKSVKHLVGREKAAVRDGGKRMATTPQEREAARAELKTLRENRPDPKDPAWNAWKARLSAATSVALSQRYAVGRINPYIGAFVIEGQGDSWAEAVANMQSRSAR